ncbi:hypothetical protein GLOIN_2v1588644 [Rhizophagus irregularis DAOM 181602=DAOM 197198]|nr:hypothetical protein GLOIN_2v1588644 [Rhizophagus irregularis DAOM 181602=DAOM 197198]
MTRYISNRVEVTKLIIIVIITIITFTIAQPTDIRCCHGSAIADNKLYIGGGLTGAGEDIFTDDFFSLDLTVSFSTLSPTDMPYKENPNVLVKCNGHTLVYAVTKNGGMIFLFGGFRSEPKGSAIYGYSLELNAWSEVIPTNGVNMPVESTTKIVGVTDSSLNNIYVFDNATMYVYDALQKSLYIAPDLAPYQIYYYATVMLSTDEIAYIGGGKRDNNDNQNNIPMDQILLYNTKISTWSTKTAKVSDGVVPSPRKGHSASIAPDGRIFIYGGFDGDENAIESTGSYPVFAVLEYNNGEFAWSSPQLFGQLYQFRIYHSSHIFGNNLIISFGRNLTHNRLNTIDIIDISNRDNYKVITDFVPPGYVSSTPSPSPSSSSSSKNSIIIASVVVSVGSLIIIGCTYYFIRRYRYRNVIPTPSSGERI